MGRTRDGKEGIALADRTCVDQQLIKDSSIWKMCYAQVVKIFVNIVGDRWEMTKNIIGNY